MNALGHRPTRRVFLVQAGGAAAAVALAACGIQPPRTQAPATIPRLGYMGGSASSAAVLELLEAFREGLRDHGYVDGQTVRLEVRHSEDRPGEWDEFAAELVAMPVDILVTPATSAALEAAARATKAVPIIGTFIEDPVASGLVASLARPGANVTGITTTLEAASAKTLELLRELAPGIRVVGLITDGITPGGRRSLKGVQIAAPELKLEVIEVVLSRERSDLPRALERATAQGVDALMVGEVPFFITDQRKEIAAYALERGIPLATRDPQWVDAGSLFAFGPNQLAYVRRLGYFADRILKGTKAGDLPIEQPATFDTVLNLKTARAIGLTIPESVLVRATTGIQ